MFSLIRRVLASLQRADEREAAFLRTASREQLVAWHAAQSRLDL